MNHTPETIKAARRLYDAFLNLAEAFEVEGENPSEGRYWRDVARDTLESLDMGYCRSCEDWVVAERFDIETNQCFRCNDRAEHEAAGHEANYRQIMTKNARG